MSQKKIAARTCEHPDDHVTVLKREVMCHDCGAVWITAVLTHDILAICTDDEGWPDADAALDQVADLCRAALSADVTT